MDAVSRACVGVGLLRKGKVVRVGTGACVDVSGLIATANHNVDRLLPGDQIVVAVPAEGRIQLEVPAIGTYGYDVNERVGLGELRAFEKSRWRWTHLALVVIETLHHELDDALGAQGLDIALIRICNRVEVLRRPGDDKRECEVTDSDASPASSPTTPELKSPSDGTRVASVLCFNYFCALIALSAEEDAEEEPPLATRVLPPPVFGWELTRSLHSPFTRHHAKTSSGNRSSKAAGGNAMADR